MDVAPERQQFFEKRRKRNEMGRFSLVTFFGEAKKVTRQQAKKINLKKLNHT
jgi:hypothetical protein